MTQIVLTEITDLQAETLNGGGSVRELYSVYFDQVQNLQINGRDGIVNIYNINFGRNRHKK